MSRETVRCIHQLIDAMAVENKFRFSGYFTRNGKYYKLTLEEMDKK